MNLADIDLANFFDPSDSKRGYLRIEVRSYQR